MKIVFEETLHWTTTADLERRHKALKEPVKVTNGHWTVYIPEYNKFAGTITVAGSGYKLHPWGSGRTGLTKKLAKVLLEEALWRIKAARESGKVLGAQR